MIFCIQTTKVFCIAAINEVAIVFLAKKISLLDTKLEKQNRLKL